MKRKYLYSGWALAIALLFTPISQSGAATLVESDNFNFSHPGSVTVNGNLLSSSTASNTITSNDALSFALFNPSLGTLNSVTLSVATTGGTFDATVSGSLLNLLSTYTLNQTEYYSLTLGSTSSTNSSVLNASGSQLIGLAPINVVTSTPSLNGNATFTLPSDLANFTGSGNLTVNVGSSDFYQIGIPIGLNSATLSGTGNYIGTATITYDYSAVPEPSTVALLAGGIFFLAWYQKRHQDSLS